ncbi:hypothetical protein D7X25_15620 [bacterium 1XD42-8]|nr:hypothetical protein D7X25_15620 [bacterium 1XD42-8]
MQEIYKHYIIDMSCNNNFVQVPTVQGDGNKVRGFEVELIANNVQYVVDPSSTYVCIGGTKPDTKQILNECEVTSQGYIHVDITQQMAAVAGRGDYSIVLIDKNTNTQLKSFPFYILTTPSSYSAQDITSSNEFGLLVEKINKVEKLNIDVQKLENTIKTNETARENAENDRIANEAVRTTNENARESAERARKDAEALRNTAETERNAKEAERDKEEQIRIAHEEERKANEAIRIHKEEERLISETARIEAELERKDEEALRQANERVRQTQESQRQLDTAFSIANVNEAAIHAQAASDYAKAQGDYANEQGGLANAAAISATEIKNELITMRDSGAFKGDKGDPGRDGVITTININQMAFQIVDGHLILTYETGNTNAEKFSINREGHLVYRVTA